MAKQWDERTKEMFDLVISNLPQFHKNIAKQLVHTRAEELAEQRGSPVVENKDVIEAFFLEVPPAFKEMMQRLFNHLNIDYSSYIKVKQSSEEVLS